MNLYDPQLRQIERSIAGHTLAPGSTHVAIIMGVHNGARWLPAQLQSLQDQSHEDWSLIVGDDQSDDKSMEVLSDFALRHGRRSIRVVPGPGKGFQANFLELLRHVPITARYVAFADQDDVWTPRKLEIAVKSFSTTVQNRAALYCGPTIVTDEALTPIGRSPRFTRPPSLSNALVQSIAGGNTMVFNRPAFELLKRSYDPDHAPVSHDWFTYQVVAGAGGHIHVDQTPSVLYRQHASNLVGAGCGVPARFKRLQRLLSGDMAKFSRQNLRALKKASENFTPSNKHKLICFEEARGLPLIRRIRMMRKAGVYRQTIAGTLALWAAVAIGKV